MDKRKFLAYILYVTLLEIREKAYQENDMRAYHLADMLHNVPLSLLDNESTEIEYERVLQSFEALGVSDWLSNRVKEFKERFSDNEE